MRLLSSVRPNERSLVASAFLALLGITAAHAMLETARDALFLSKLPATHLPLMYLAIAGAGLLLSRTRVMRASRGSVVSSLGLASLVSGAFWLLFRQGSPLWLLYGLYVWTGTFASWLVLRFWLLLGSALTPPQARRLFGLIGTGGVLGAVLGAGTARLLVQSADVGVLLVASMVLLVTAFGPAVWLAGLAPREPRELAPPTPPTLRADLGLVRGSPYLKRVLAIALLSTIALTLVDYLFKSLVAGRGGSAEELAAFFASTYFVLNLLALVVQSVGMSWLIRLLGIHGALLVLPAVLLLGSGGLLASGTMFAALLLKGADGSLRHSLHRTCVELLFVPLADGLRQRTKPLIDLLGQRGGQAVASLAILAFSALGLRRTLLELALLALCVAWTIVALGLRRHYIDLFRFALPPARKNDGGRSAGTQVGSVQLRQLAAEHLDALLYAPEARARERGLETLVELCHSRPSLTIEPAGLRRAIDRALSEAYARLDARLSTSDPEACAELAKEQRNATERAFRLLSLLEPKEGYELIHRGLMSDDARAHALCLELCENVTPRELRPALIGLVDKLDDAERMASAAPYYLRTRPELRLARASLAGQVLNEADLRGADLRGATLVGAQLRGARLDGADLRGADLTRVDARGASFERARLDGASLDAANLVGARGVGATLVGCHGVSPSFDSGDWTDADFSHSRLDGPNFDNAALRGARFAAAELRAGRFHAAGLVDVVFDDAHLQHAELSSTGLVGCSFERARLDDSHWALVSIHRSRFDGSACPRMSWLRCEAGSVVFDGSDLTASSWKESKVSAAQFNRACFERATFVDFDFVRTSLALAKLRNVTTMRLQLIACELRDADTRGSELPPNRLALFAPRPRGEG